MRKRRVVRLPVVEAELIEELLTDALKDSSLENRRRRSVGLALSSLAKARRRNKKRYLPLYEQEAVSLLRGLANVSGWLRSRWDQYFGA